VGYVFGKQGTCPGVVCCVVDSAVSWYPGGRFLSTLRTDKSVNFEGIS